MQTAVLGCRKAFPLFQEFLTYYDSAVFRKEDGTEDVTTNVEILTNLCLSHGLQTNGMFQMLDGLAVYPCEFFCPIAYETRKMHKTYKTVAIHWFSGSWHTEEELKEMRAERIRKRTEWIKNLRYRVGKVIFGEQGYEKLKAVMKKKK